MGIRTISKLVLTGNSTKFLNDEGRFVVPPSLNQVNSDWEATSGVAEILNKPDSLASDRRYARRMAIALGG